MLLLVKLRLIAFVSSNNAHHARGLHIQDISVLTMS
jgi:hypothetical protein